MGGDVSLPYLGGQALGTLAMLESLRRPGGLGQYLVQRGELAGDPRARPSLENSNFFAGIAGVPLERRTVEGAPPAGGGPGAPTSRLVARLPKLPAAEQVKLDEAQLMQRILEGGDVSDLTSGQRAVLGIQPSFAQQIKDVGGLTGGSGFRVSKIGPTGPVFESIPTNVGLERTNVPGLYRDSATGKIVRGPADGGGGPPSRIAPPPGMIQTGARVDSKGRVLPTFGLDKGEKVTKDELTMMAAGNDPHRPGERVAGPVRVWAKRALKEFGREKVATAEATATSKPAAQRIQEEVEQMTTLDQLIGGALTKLQNPQVRQQLGLIAGRVGFAEYKAGFATNPLEEEFTTTRELIRVLSVGRLARASGSRSYLVWRELDVHPPQAGDQVELIESKLNTLRGVLRASATNATTIARTPVSRLGTLVPGAQGGPTAAPTGAGDDDPILDLRIGPMPGGAP
jgi:hypothetical protein